MVRIGAFAFTRLIVLLRRIWKSLDRIAIAQEALVAIEKERLYKEFPIVEPKKPRNIEIGYADVEELNRKYKETYG